MAQAKYKAVPAKKDKRTVTNAIVHIHATFNNTIVAFSDLEGNIISWASAGVIGFKGSRKSTPYAAKLVGENALGKALTYGVKSVEIHVKGPGSGRESALRSISSPDIRVTKILDITPLPHNGCRPPKKRRI